MTYTTEVSHTQSGTTNRDFNVTFPFLATTDLRVQLNGVTKALTSDYTIVQSGANTVVNFNTAPANNDTIRIFRDTAIDTISATFVGGSSIRSTDLNNCYKQLLFAAQEFGTLKEDNSVSFSLGDKGDMQINSSSDWQLQNNVVEHANMASNSVGTQELINSSVTTEKLGTLSITSGELATNSVTTAKINDEAVTTAKLPDNVITTPKVVNDAIDPTKINQTVTAGYGFTPPGAVIWYAGNTAPTGYIKCNGDSIPNGTGTVQGVTTDFSGLYAVVGGNVPDLRGEFIRALDDGRGVDASRGIRSEQSESYKSHGHAGDASSAGNHTHGTTVGNSGNLTLNTPSGYSASSYETDTKTIASWDTMNNTPEGSDNWTGATISTRPGANHNHPVTEPTAGAHTHNLNITNSGGDETRPRNVALLACIKY